MNKLFYVILLFALMCLTAACSNNQENIILPPSDDNAALEIDNIAETVKPDADLSPETLTQSLTKEEDFLNIEITIRDKTFSAKLYDNEAAKKFSEMLPLTLDMTELNGNEKYFYLSDNLPANSKRPDKINSGDIMLYGSNCIVLFYDTFSTSYSYTPIGCIEDTTELISALGEGDIEVKFDTIQQ